MPVEIEAGMCRTCILREKAAKQERIFTARFNGGFRG